MNEAMSAGDAFPSNCEIIEVHVAELKQLFNAIDLSPFNDRDLDPSAEEFIVSWGRELPRDAPLALLVHLERSAGLAEEEPSCAMRFTGSSAKGLMPPDGNCGNCFAVVESASLSDSHSWVHPSLSVSCWPGG